jgi:hypothetical protein
VGAALILRVRPGQGLGEFELGMTRAEVVARHPTGREFVKNPSYPPVLYYADEDVLLHFDNERVALIEAGGNSRAEFRGIDLLNRPLLHVVDALQSLGLTVSRDSDGAEVESLGVGLYAPGQLIEGIAVHPISTSQAITS